MPTITAPRKWRRAAPSHIASVTAGSSGGTKCEFDDFWKPFLEKQGPAGAYAASLSVEDREALRLRLRGRLLGAGPDKAIVMHARAWAVRGTIPGSLQRSSG